MALIIARKSRRMGPRKTDKAKKSRKITKEVFGTIRVQYGFEANRPRKINRKFSKKLFTQVLCGTLSRR